MKFMLVALVFSFAGQAAFAQASTKPQNIVLELQQDVTVSAPDAKSGDEPYTTLKGLNGADCSIYNEGDSKLVLVAGTKILLRAAYWDSEASWEAEASPKQASISLSCGGGIIPSEIKTANPSAPDLTPAVLVQINAAMKGQLTVESAK